MANHTTGVQWRWQKQYMFLLRSSSLCWRWQELYLLSSASYSTSYSGRESEFCLPMPVDYYRRIAAGSDSNFNNAAYCIDWFDWQAQIWITSLESVLLSCTLTSTSLWYHQPTVSLLLCFVMWVSYIADIHNSKFNFLPHAHKPQNVHGHYTTCCTDLDLGMTGGSKKWVFTSIN